MTRMKVTPRVGQRRVPARGPSAGTPSLLREMEKRRRKLEGLEALGKLPGSPNTGAT